MIYTELHWIPGFYVLRVVAARPKKPFTR